MKRVTYPTEDGGAIHEYTKKKEIAATAATAATADTEDETIIRVKLGSNVDFVRMESICISRKERD